MLEVSYYKMSIRASSLKEARDKLRECGFHITKRQVLLEGEEYIFTLVI